MTSCWLPGNTKSFKKGQLIKKKNLYLKQHFFPLKVDPSEKVDKK